MSVKKTTKIHAAPTPDTLTTEDLVGSAEQNPVVTEKVEEVESVEQNSPVVPASSPSGEQGYRPQQTQQRKSA